MKNIICVYFGHIQWYEISFNKTKGLSILLIKNMYINVSNIICTTNSIKHNTVTCNTMQTSWKCSLFDLFIYIYIQTKYLTNITDSSSMCLNMITARSWFLTPYTVSWSSNFKTLKLVSYSTSLRSQGSLSTCHISGHHWRPIGPILMFYISVFGSVNACVNECHATVLLSVVYDCVASDCEIIYWVPAAQRVALDVRIKKSGRYQWGLFL